MRTGEELGPSRHSLLPNSSSHSTYGATLTHEAHGSHGPEHRGPDRSRSEHSRGEGSSGGDSSGDGAPRKRRRRRGGRGRSRREGEGQTSAGGPPRDEQFDDRDE